MNRKRTDILSAAVKLCLDGGARKLTMDEIAAAAKVSKVTLYKYFDHKDALFEAVGVEIYQDFAARVMQAAASSESLKVRLYRFLDIVCEFSDSKKFDLCKQLSAYTSVSTAQAGYRLSYEAALYSLIGEGQKAGLFRDGISDELLFHYIDMGVSYYQQDMRYREKMRTDGSFRENFMAFFIGNIFEQPSRILAPGEAAPEYPTALQRYIALAKEGTRDSIGKIMAHLNKDMTIADSKLLDFALGQVESEEGVAVMEEYLFHGTQIQRNYCTLYFGRRGEYLLIRKAFDLGLIDAKQAFSR